MEFTAEIEGLEELKIAAAHAEEDLRDELRTVSLEAAESGIQEAQANHPYEDQTFRLSGSARAVPVRGEAEMRWPADYASHVDEGTSRARAYPFTPQATQRATAALEAGAERAVKRFIRKIEE